MTPGPLRSVAVVVLDSVGIGGAPDAADFGDEGSATLPHVADAVGGISLPNLEAIGLGHIVEARGIEAAPRPAGAFAVMTEASPGKDTTTGHWEMAGVILDRPFPTYPDGFPAGIVEEFVAAAGVPGILGNVAASGTEIIRKLGEEHFRTKKPIVYTSADSVFQVAAHVDVVPLEDLYDMCRTARRILSGPHEVGRVIARPFGGEPGAFERTVDRHDFAVEPPQDTILDEISAAGLEVRAIGKISDIFAGRGVTSSRPTASNSEGMDAIVEAVSEDGGGLIFANLVDFDQSYGHRNDPTGYAQALEEFDRRLPKMVGALSGDQLMVITADHGNDPTTPSTDHSRERVPVLLVGDHVRPGAHAGVRRSFADLGATVAELLGVATKTPGDPFVAEVSRG
jgi:phosphopentomutase